MAELARTRDPDGFAELTALCGLPGRADHDEAAVRRVATIVAVKGGTVHEITVGDCLELSLTLDGDTRRNNNGLGFYQLLHQMGVFGPQAPSTLRAFATQGQLSPAQMLEPYGIDAPRSATCCWPTCTNGSRSSTTPACAAWRPASAGCSGGTWNSSPGHLLLQLPQRSPRHGNNGC